MELQLDIFNIEGIRFAKRTGVSDRVLEVNRQELQELLQQDRRLSEVGLELASPGENCRILQVADVIEPRFKTENIGEDFPGVLSRAGTAGRGKTRVLRGAAVVISNQGEAPDIGDSDDALGAIIDMSGPAAELSLYAKLHNLVLIPYPAAGVSREGYRIAMKLAGLKAAVYLARAARDLKPDQVELYNLPPVTHVAKGAENLPKVAYIFQIHCTSYPPIVGEPILYGDNGRLLLPTIVHPNEVMDGALVNPYDGIGMETYSFQNHAVIKELYRSHEKELHFVGVILTVSRTTEPERERSVAMASNQAKFVLGADGVIITKSSSGAPDVDASQTAQRCEEMGVRAVLIMFDRSLNSEVGAVFNLPLANGIVSTANSWSIIELPSMKRIIGKQVILPSGACSRGELKKPIRWIRGALDQTGHSKIMSVRY